MIWADFAFLADYAAERGGYVVAHGIGIDSLMAERVPATHPLLYLVAQLRCPAEDAGRKPIVIRVVDDQGKAVLEQQGEAAFVVPQPGKPALARMVLGFHMIQFHRFGKTVFEVKVGGQDIVKLPLRVQASGHPMAYN